MSGASHAADPGSNLGEGEGDFWLPNQIVLRCPTFLYLTCSILGEGDFWLPNQIVLRLGLDLTDV